MSSWRRSRARLSRRNQGAFARLRPSRSALAFAVGAAFTASAVTAFANPSGASIVAGGVTFSVNGNTLIITNTPGAIINWQQFSIRRDEVTRFIQQHAASGVLNRVVGQNPSLILGQLTSNGRVFLINPSGIAFGKSAVIDVAGFAASSLNISDADFISGRMRFEGTGLEGKVRNAGTIRTADGGHVYLIAPNVENKASGVISSPNGEVVIAAGKSVELVNSRTPDLRVEFVAPNNQAVNAGDIVAASGSVGIYGTLIKNSGHVSASRAVVGDGGKIVFKATKDVTLESTSRLEANGAKGGEIKVQAQGGTTLVGGALEAKGQEGKGGEVQLLGRFVGLVDNALVDASGELGGGTVLIGGDFQGKNADVQNAEKTYVGGNVVIRANAVAEGDGGKVIVWADDWTKFYGSIEARGGAAGGNGGLAEVSGFNTLAFDGRVDLSAPSGNGGALLLDPNNITIASGGLASLLLAGDLDLDSILTFAEGGGTLLDQTINAGAITTILNSGTAVELLAHTDITVDQAITSTGNGGLTLRAGDDVFVNQAITLANGSLSLIAGDAGGTPTGGNADAGRNITIGAAIGTGSGTVTMSATDSIAVNAAVTNSSSVSLTSTAGAISQSVVTGSISTGTLATSSVGGTVLNGGNTVSSFSAANTPNGTVELTNTAATLTVTGISQGDGGLTISNAGNVTVAGAVTAASTGAISLTASGFGNNVQLNSSVSSGSGTVAVTAANNVVIGNGVTVSTSGAVNLTATAGQILENGVTAGKVVAGALTTLSALGQTLSGANQVNVFNATNTGASGAITLSNSATPLSVTGSNANGDFIVSQTGSLSTGTISAVNVDLTGTAGISIGNALTATGTLDLTSSNTAIGQNSGLATITVTGITTVDAGSGSIGLDLPSNNFQAAVNLTGGTTTIADTNALTLGALSTGNLTVTSGGALNLGQGSVTGTGILQVTSGGDVTQSGALTVTGTATIGAGANDITLENASNNFSSVVLTGNDVSLRDTNDLAATATAGGSLTLNAGGVLSTGGALSGVDVALTGTGGISLGHAVTATGTLGLTSTNQNIGQGIGGVITASGITTINAGANGDISLQLPTNDFQSTVHLTGRDAHVVDKNALTLGTLALGTDLTATANADGISTGTLNLGSGNIGNQLFASSARGDITQTGGLTVGFGGTINAGTGNIILTDPANDFGLMTIALTGANVSLADTDALLVSATASGTLTLSAGGTLTTGGALSGTDIDLTGTTGITLMHAVDAGDTLNLTASSGTIGQTGPGAITAVGITTVNAGAGQISLDVPSNDFQSDVSLTAGGAVNVQDVNDLTVSLLSSGANGSVRLVAGGQLTLPATAISTGTGSIELRSNGGTFATNGTLTTTTGGITLVGSAGVDVNHALSSTTGNVAISGGGVTIDAPVSTGGNVTLNSSAAVTQTAAITAAGLELLGAGPYTLTDASNDVDTIAASTSSALSYRDASGLIVGQVNTTQGITTSGNDATLQTGGTLAIDHGVNVGAGDLTLNAGGAVTEGGGITAAGLELLGAGPYTLTGSNTVGTIAGNVSGAVEYTGNGAFSVGTVNSTSGLTATDIVLSAGGTLTLAQDLDAGAGDVRLVTFADVSQTGGAITAASLGVRAFDGVSLTSTTNNVATLAIQSGGPVSYIDSDGFTIGTVGALGAFAISTSGVAAGGSDNLTLTAGGAVTQAAGADISSFRLELLGTGSFTLTNADNDTQVLAGNVTGPVHYRDAGDFEVSQVNSTVGLTTNDANITLIAGTTAPNDTLALNADVSAGTGIVRLVAGDIVQNSGGIVGSGLGVNALRGVSLTSATNNVGTLAIANTNSGDVAYADADGFAIGTVSGFDAFTTTTGIPLGGSNPNLKLSAGGAVTQAVGADISSFRIELLGAGSFTLTNAGNETQVLAADVIGAVHYRDAGEFEVSTVNGTTGVKTSNADITLVTGTLLGSDRLTLNADVDAGTGIVRLVAGDIVQNSGGIIAGALGVNTLKGAILTSATNNVGTLAINNTMTGDVSYADSDGFTIGTVSGFDAFATTTGITLGGSNPNLTLSAGGAVTQAVGADISSFRIELLGAGSFTLTNAGNETQVLAADVTGAVHYTDSADFQVGGVNGTLGVKTGNADITLITNTPSTLRLVADVDAGTGTVRLVAGDVDQQSGSVLAGQLGVIAQDGVILASTTNNVSTLAISNALSGDVRYTDADGFAIGTVTALGGFTPDVNGISNATRNVSLTAGGAVTQTQAITAAGLELLGTGSYALTLATNDVDTLAVDTGGTVSYRDTNDLVVGTVNTVGITTTNDNVTLQAGTTLAINQAVSVGAGNLTLDVGTAATQTATITAAGLELQGAGDYTLTNTGNNVGTISGSTTGSVKYIDANALAVGTVTTAGFTSAANVSLNPQTGDLSVTAELTVTGLVTLQADTGNVTQTAAGVITASTLGVNAGAGIDLDAAPNLAANVALRANGAALSYRSADSYVIDVVGPDTPVFSGADGVSAGVNDVTLVTDAGTLTQTTGRNVTAGGLELQGAGSYTLANTGNSATTIAGSTTGTVKYINAGALTVGTVATAGFTGAANVSLNTQAGDLSVTQEITASGLVTLQALTGNVTQTASGVITADTLGVNAGIGIDLGAAPNSAANVALRANGASLSYRSAGGYLIDMVTSDGTFFSVDVDGVGAGSNNVTLITDAGAVTQAAGKTVFAGGLELRGAGSYALNDSGNDATTLAVNTGGAVSYRDTNDLVVGTVNTVGITTTNDNVTLQSAGTLAIDSAVNLGTGNLTLNAGGAATQSASITAAGLELLGTGPYTLTHPGNDAATIAGSTADAINYVDANALAVGMVNATIGITTTANGAVTLNAGGALTLLVTTGNLNADGAVSLTAGGGISTAANVTTTDDDITFSSATTLTGDIVLNTGAAGAGNVLFGSTLTGTSAGLDDLTISAGTGNVTFTGAVGTTRLGAIQINSAAGVMANAITAASLTQVAGTGTTTLNGAVNVNATTAGVSLTTNAISIAAAGDITAEGTVTLTGPGGIGTAGDITTTGDNITFGSATTLAGDVVLVSTGGAVAFNSSLTATNAGLDDLAITAGAGAVTVTGRLGATRLGSVTLNSAGVAQFLDTSANQQASSLSVVASTSTTFSGKLDLTGGVTLASGAGNVSFLNGFNTGAASTFGNTGTLQIGDDVADGSSVHASLVHTAGATTLGGSITIATPATPASVQLGATTVAADTTLSAAVGTVDFGNVTGPGGLTVTAADTTTFGGTVSTAFLTTNGGGTTRINGGSVTTAGAQTYTDNVSASLATSLTSGSGGIGFAGSFTGPGGANDLTVSAGTGAFSVTGALTAFNNLTVNSASDVTLTNAANALAGTVRFASASGSVDYREAGAITLGASAITGSARIVSGDGGIITTGAISADGGIALVAHDITGGNTGTINIGASITTQGGQVTLNAADDITVNGAITSNNGNVDIVAGNSDGINYAAIRLPAGTVAADEAGNGDNFGAVHFSQQVNAGTGEITIVTAGDVNISGSQSNVTQSAGGALVSSLLTVVTLKGPGGLGVAAGADIVLNSAPANNNASVRFFACESTGCPTPALSAPIPPVNFVGGNEYAAGQIFYSGTGGVNLIGLGTISDFYSFVNGPFTLTANPFSAGNITIESDNDIIIDLAQNLTKSSDNPASSLNFYARGSIRYVNKAFGNPNAGGGTIGTPATPFSNHLNFFAADSILFENALYQSTQNLGLFGHAAYLSPVLGAVSPQGNGDVTLQGNYTVRTGGNVTVTGRNFSLFGGDMGGRFQSATGQELIAAGTIDLQNTGVITVRAGTSATATGTAPDAALHPSGSGARLQGGTVNIGSASTPGSNPTLLIIEGGSNAVGVATSDTSNSAIERQQANAVVRSDGDMKIYLGSTSAAGTAALVTVPPLSSLPDPYSVVIRGGTATASNPGATPLFVTSFAALQAKTLTMETGGTILFQGGTANLDTANAFAASSALLLVQNDKTITTRNGGSVVLIGGNANVSASDPFRSIPMTSDSARNALAIAQLDPSKLTMTVDGILVLQGGTTTGPAGALASARIDAGDEIKITVNGTKPYSYPGSGTLGPASFYMIGGPDSGFFDSNNVDLAGSLAYPQAFPITVTLAGPFQRVFDSGLAAGVVQTGLTTFDDSLLSYVIFAANVETRALRFRGGLGEIDDVTTPACK